MPKITVYSTNTCGYCVMLKNWLAENKIDYTEHKVDEDPAAADAMVSMSGQMGVPFTTIEEDDKTIGILGFDLPQFKEVLAVS